MFKWFCCGAVSFVFSCIFIFQDVVAGTLSDGLDNYDIAWATGVYRPGNSQETFVYTTAYFYSGGDSVRAYGGQENAYVWLAGTVTGSVDLSYWWKASTEDNRDFFSFYDNGVLVTRISGNSGWLSGLYSVPAGAHELKWEYRRDANGFSGWNDEVFLDYVVISAAPTPTPTPIPTPTPTPTPVPTPDQGTSTAVPTSANVDTGGIALVFGSVLSFFGIIWGIRKLILLLNRS